MENTAAVLTASQDTTIPPSLDATRVSIPPIVHVDVDAFFASVEQVLNPRLRGKPVLVGRGVVASASYEAKFAGVRTAMSLREAKRLCPRAIVVPGQYEHYADFAARVRRILESFTPVVETAALDDFYLDFTGTNRLYPDFPAALRRVQSTIHQQTGLSVSVKIPIPSHEDISPALSPFLCQGIPRCSCTCIATATTRSSGPCPLRQSWPPQPPRRRCWPWR